MRLEILSEVITGMESAQLKAATTDKRVMEALEIRFLITTLKC